MKFHLNNFSGQVLEKIYANKISKTDACLFPKNKFINKLLYIMNNRTNKKALNRTLKRIRINKTKTIAILTFHSAKSYGAVLQTFALNTYLRSQGYNVRIINLRPPAITSFYACRPKSWLEAFIFGIFERKYFNCFPGVYRKVDELKISPPIADYYIVGSDQVWNPEITKEYQLHYFFDFVPEGNRLISYAASFGKETIKIDNKNKIIIKELLNKFHAISMRESSGVKICKELYEVDAEETVDPTFLISDYSEITGSVQEKNQIVCFKLKKRHWFI